MRIPYERAVQWLAGPISIGAGYLATQLVAHVSLFNALGITQDQTAKAIVATATFVVGSAVTYLGHSKWLDNLSKWWQHLEAQQQPAGVASPANGDYNPEHALAADRAD